MLQYSHDGLRELPNRLRLATDDTSQYLDNTGREINALLVTNYAELEEVLGEILDESGPILKRTLAQVTQAVAIDNLVSCLLQPGLNMWRNCKISVANFGSKMYLVKFWVAQNIFKWEFGFIYRQSSVKIQPMKNTSSK